LKLLSAGLGASEGRSGEEGATGKGGPDATKKGVTNAGH
jgi:hypothetical protein